jgi:hypothetical protein
MATSDRKQPEDAPGAVPAVLKDYVGVKFKFDLLEQQMHTLRGWLEQGGNSRRQLYAVMAASQLASDLLARLIAMQITLAGEE